MGYACAEIEVNGSDYPVLESVLFDSVLNGLYLETHVKYCYSNPTSNSIEAIYTFPVPTKAILFDVSLTIGDQVYKGVVQAKAKAQNDYEEAIEDGHTAMLLVNRH